MPGRATSSARAIALLNQQRRLNGIPEGLAEDPTLSEGCREYDHYRALNPNDPPHQEIPGHRGYTALGAGSYGFGYSEVNAFDDEWTNTTNSWDSAPIHQSLMFDPAVTTVGCAFAEGTACMRFAGFVDPGGPAFFAFTSDAGPAAVGTSETASEWPYVPQQLVGVPAGKETGPNLLAFATGFGNAHVALARLARSSDGALSKVRVVDETTPGTKGFF